jgi:hypothetical protein
MEFKLGAKHASNQQQQQQQQQQRELGDVELQKAAAAAVEVQCKEVISVGKGVDTQQQQQQQQQQDDHLQDTDQCSLHEVEQQQLLLHVDDKALLGSLQKEQIALGNNVNEQQQQQQQQRLQVHFHSQQEQCLPCSTAAHSGDDADACVVLLHSSSSSPSTSIASNSAPHAGHQEQLQQQIDKSGRALDVESSSRTSKQAPDAGNIQTRQQQQQQQQVSVNFWQGLRQLLSSPAVLVFMWQAIVMGFGIGG